MRIDISVLKTADLGEKVRFDLTKPQPDLGDIPSPANLRTQGIVIKFEDRLVAKGTASLTVGLECGRCLISFRHPLKLQFSEEFAQRPGEEQFPIRHDELDLAPMLRTVVLLAIPAVPLHDSECRGLCPVCGKNLNDEPHDHPAASPESPFQELDGKAKIRRRRSK